MPASENNEQKLLPEGFANVYYKIVLALIMLELFNDFVVWKVSSGTLLLVEDVVATILETRTTYFKSEPHFLIDQHTAFLCYVA